MFNDTAATEIYTRSLHAALPIWRSDVAALLPGLKRVAPWLRTQLAHKLSLRTVPELHFQPDTALDTAMHVDSLLRLPEVQRDLGPTEEDLTDED